MIMEDSLLDPASAAPSPPLSSPTLAGAGAAAFPKAPRRWLVLLAFSLSNALNAYLWISFAPIANLTAARFAVQPGRAELLGAALRWDRIAWQAASGSQPAQLEARAELEPLPVALLPLWQLEQMVAVVNVL